MPKVTLKIKKKDGTTYDVSNYSGLNSINVLNQSNTDATTIKYGAVAASGQFELGDLDGEISNLIDNGQLDDSDVECAMFLNNSSTPLCNIITTDTTYNNDGLVLNANATDSIEYWSEDDVIIDSSDKNVLKDYNGIQFLSKIIGKAIPDINTITFANSYPFNTSNVMNIGNFLSLANIKDVNFDEEYSAKTLIQYFCDLFQLNFFNEKNGLYLLNSRPIITNSQYVLEHSNNEKDIFISKSSILNDSGTNKFIKNKYKKINIPIVNIDYQNKVLPVMDASQSDLDDLSYVNDHSAYSSKEYFKSSEIVNDFEFVEEFYESRADVTWEIYRKEITLFNGDYIKTNNNTTNGYFRIAYLLPQTKSEIEEHGNRLYIFNSNILTLSSHELFKQDIRDHTFDGSQRLTFVYLGIINESSPDTTIHSHYFRKITLEVAIRQSIIQALDSDMYVLLNGLKFWMVSGNIGSVNYSIQTREKKVVSFIKDGYEDSDIKLEETLELPENPFLTSTSTAKAPSDNLAEYPLYEYIAYNILKDYENGIKTKKIQVCAKDYNYVDGEEAISFKNGECFEVGKTVKIENEEQSWRITGVDKHYDGEIYYDLELQECLRVEDSDPRPAGMYYAGGIFVKSWNDMVKDNQITISNGSVTGTNFAGIIDSTHFGYLRIPDSIQYIGDNAFSGETYLKRILFNDKIKSIGENAFQNCSSIDTFVIQDSVNYIGANAFNGCSSLTSLTFEDTESWESNGVSVDVTNPTTNAQLFKAGTQFAFERKPFGLYNISDELIYTWQELINNGDVVLQAPESDFSSNDYILVSFNSSLEGKLKMPNNIAVIGYRAFAYSHLSQINIPTSVFAIGQSAFDNSYNLYNIEIPNSVTIIGDRAFARSGLRTVTLGSGITSTSTGMFELSMFLQQVTLNSSITTIADRTFYGCDNLEIINLSNVTNIGNYAFSANHKLQSVTLSNNITTIGEHAFEFCERITSITFPSLLTYIGNNAFEGTGLTSATFSNTSNWYYYYNIDYPVSISVTNPTTNARNLTIDYVRAKWAKL